MKKIYLLLTIFLLPLFIFSQEIVRPIALEDAAFDAYFKNAVVPIVKGKLINASAKELSEATINYSLVTPFSDLQVKKTVQISKDGTFKLEIDYAFPYQEIFMRVGDFCYIGIWANKDLFIELDVKMLKSLNHSDISEKGVKFLGTDGKLNSYLSDFIHFKRSESMALRQKKVDLVSDRGLNSITFHRQYDSVFAELEHIEKAFILMNSSPYAWLLENERLSDYYGPLLYRSWDKKMDDTLWKRINLHKSFLISNSGMEFYTYLYEYIKSVYTPYQFISLNDLMKDLSESDKTVNDSLNYYDKIIQESPSDSASHTQKVAGLNKYQKNLEPKMLDLYYEKSNSKIAHFLDSLFAPSKSDLLKFQIGSKDPVKQIFLINYALSGMHTGWTKKILNIEYQKTLNKIEDINKILSQSSSNVSSLGFGAPIMQTTFGASLYKISGIKAFEFLAKLRSAFPNKALLLDFWATWCSPCLQDLPYSKKLHEESMGLPVEFIYLCTSSGSDETKWKAKIAELKQPGIHFFVDQSLENELMNQFSFSGFPSYAFFDKNGQYKPGAISWMSNLSKEGLAELVNIKQSVKQ